MSQLGLRLSTDAGLWHSCRQAQAQADVKVKDQKMALGSTYVRKVKLAKTCKNSSRTFARSILQNIEQMNR